jgi:hypothetical protein
MDKIRITHEETTNICETEVGKLKGIDNFGDLGVDGRAILRKILKKCDSMDCIHLAQYNVQRRSFTNAIMNQRVA